MTTIKYIQPYLLIVLSMLLCISFSNCEEDKLVLNKAEKVFNYSVSFRNIDSLEVLDFNLDLVARGEYNVEYYSKEKGKVNRNLKLVGNNCDLEFTAFEHKIELSLPINKLENGEVFLIGDMSYVVDYANFGTDSFISWSGPVSIDKQYKNELFYDLDRSFNFYNGQVPAYIKLDLPSFIFSGNATSILHLKR